MSTDPSNTDSNLLLFNPLVANTSTENIDPPITSLIFDLGFNTVKVRFHSENDAIKACILLRNLGLGLTYEKGTPMKTNLANDILKFDEAESLLLNNGLFNIV